MHEITQTDHYAIIGNPIAHSLSPYIHQRFAKLTGEDIIYQSLQSESHSFAHDLREFLYYGKGLNITAPFKQMAVAVANQVSSAALLAQAANVLIKQEDNSILAENTDGIGLINDLKCNQSFELKNKAILIIGAGGAAQGILELLLAENPKQVALTNRSLVKAKELSKRFAIEALALEKLSQFKPELIIHASSIMPTIPADYSTEGAFCYDLNYGERSSDFKRWAKQQKAPYVDGIGLLVEQAAESFYLWRGIRPETKELITELRKSRP